MFGEMVSLAQRRPGMLARVVTGQYCSVHQVLFVSSLQEWLSCSPAQIAYAWGDAMHVVEATCPRCLAMTRTAMQRQFPALYAPSLPAPGTCDVHRDGTVVRDNGMAVAPDGDAASHCTVSASRGVRR